MKQNHTQFISGFLHTNPGGGGGILQINLSFSFFKKNHPYNLPSMEYAPSLCTRFTISKPRETHPAGKRAPLCSHHNPETGTHKTFPLHNGKYNAAFTDPKSQSPIAHEGQLPHPLFPTPYTLLARQATTRRHMQVTTSNTSHASALFIMLSKTHRLKAGNPHHATT